MSKGEPTVAPVDIFASEEERLLCHLYQVLLDDLPSCGCGWPEAANKLVWQVLCLMPTYGPEKKQQLRELIGPEGVQQIVLCALDQAGLIGHGTCTDSAWLEPRGRWLLWAVERTGGIDGLGDRLGEVGYPHYDRECDEDCWVVPDDWAPAGEVPDLVVPIDVGLEAAAGRAADTSGPAFTAEDFPGIESASERMGSFLTSLFEPPLVPGEHRFGLQWVPLLDDEGQPVLDEFGEPEMVPDVVAPYLTIQSIQPITPVPRFTGILAYLREEQR